MFDKFYGANSMIPVANIFVYYLLDSIQPLAQK